MGIIIDNQTEAHQTKKPSPSADKSHFDEKQEATHTFVNKHTEKSRVNEKRTETTTHIKVKNTEANSLQLIKQPKMQSFFSVIQPKSSFPLAAKTPKEPPKSNCLSADKMQKPSLN